MVDPIITASAIIGVAISGSILYVGRNCLVFGPFIIRFDNNARPSLASQTKEVLLGRAILHAPIHRTAGVYCVEEHSFYGAFQG